MFLRIYRTSGCPESGFVPNLHTDPDLYAHHSVLGTCATFSANSRHFRTKFCIEIVINYYFLDD